MMVKLTQKDKKTLLQCLTDSKIDTKNLSEELLKTFGLEFMHFMSTFCEDGNEVIPLKKEDKAAFIQAILKGMLDTSMLSENLIELGKFDFQKLMIDATCNNE